jgi:hypothetical protein
MNQRCEANTFSFYIRWAGKDKASLNRLFLTSLNTTAIEIFRVKLLSGNLYVELRRGLLEIHVLSESTNSFSSYDLSCTESNQSYFSHPINKASTPLPNLMIAVSISWVNNSYNLLPSCEIGKNQ